MKKVIIKSPDTNGKDIYVGRSCKGCIFIEEDYNSCCTKRKDKFVARGETNYELVTRMCNMYRDEEWRQRCIDSSPTDDYPCWMLDDFIDKARQEVESRFLFVLDSFTHGAKYVWRACNAIKKLDYNPKKIGVIISGKIGEDVEELVHEVNVMKQFGIPCQLVLSHPDLPTPNREYEVMSKAKDWYTHVITLEDSTIICIDTLRIIDNLLNDDLEKTLYVLFKDTGLHCISYGMMNSIYLKYGAYDAMLDNVITELSESGMYTIL